MKLTALNVIYCFSGSLIFIRPNPAGSPIEEPVSQDEKRILGLIRDGYQNMNHKTNHTQNLFGFTKLEKTPEI